MNYTVYQTTNIETGKIYIGCHKTQIPNDEYLGSGKHLKNSIKKYGKENFTKEILFNYDNEFEMYEKEFEIVDENFICRQDTYNIVLGGCGGGHLGMKHSKETKNIMKYNNLGNKNPFYGKHHNNESKKKISNTHKGNQYNLGKSRSQKTKNKISKSMKGLSKSQKTKNKISGENNYKFSGYWVTPNGNFITLKEASLNIGSSSLIMNWCKNSNKIISKNNIGKSKYLQSLKDYPLGKTFNDIGFSFIHK